MNDFFMNIDDEAEGPAKSSVNSDDGKIMMKLFEDGEIQGEMHVEDFSRRKMDESTGSMTSRPLG